VVARGNTRSDDPGYLALVKTLYEQIGVQFKGLLWKDGGPVIGIQLENEFGGPAEHLLALKQLARDAGLDVPLYTRTGWPALKTPMPFGEIVPLYGVYAEGFWDRELTAMPGKYWAGFHFSTLRTDANIANEALGRRDVKDAPDVARYPYLTCEIGGGMMSSYHRRILVDPRDVESTTLVKLGSGSNSPGYYMYHGGTNPDGKLTTLMEEQATAMTNWNDMPVKNYDFQAPLGACGEIRPQYHLLRRLHLFLHDFGASLAGMATALPDERPTGKDDTTTLRWAVRSDGVSGFLFVNNYERLKSLPAKTGVQFTLNSPGRGPIVFPSTPVTIPADARFLWPFNLDLGNSVKLAWATAQPLCVVEEDNRRTYFFAETPGVAPEFVFTGARIIAHNGEVEVKGDGYTRVRGVRPDRNIAFVANSTVQVVLLSEADSLALWKGRWLGRDRVFLTTAGLVLDGDKLRLTSENLDALQVSVFPTPQGRRIVQDGAFSKLPVPPPPRAGFSATVSLVKPAGPPRAIQLGAIKQPVAAAPVDADFANAAVYKINIPSNAANKGDLLLRLHYAGDVARIMVGGKFVLDDYANGGPFDISLKRYAETLKEGELTVAILPIQRNAPIYFSSPSALPDFGTRDAVAELYPAELFTRYTAEITGLP
ncbi:MAG TPA: beta-galactosidase, partial [Candidatus Didemnitutus sp.]|nr:beta-galactosidase [Candidatus Didemnitutus sp.]